jgi:hypothetical protein
MDQFVTFWAELFGLLGDTPGQRFGAGVALLSGIASIFAFLRNQAAATREARLARYDAVSQSYIEFQKLCLEHAQLGNSWYQSTEERVEPISFIEQAQQDIIFDILTSTLERAFLTYKDAPESIRKSQWPGWESFARAYAERKDYRSWWRRNVFDFEAARWNEGDTQYDLAFEKFLVGLLLAGERRK